jgi:crotonobetainyl-CoA:carnitine CoA-transferase CaiB-like acyl-CoA transferase
MIDGNHIFSGLKVLDLASFIAGPAATTILADFGADVVKVEPPVTGDPARPVLRWGRRDDYARVAPENVFELTRTKRARVL